MQAELQDNEDITSTRNRFAPPEDESMWQMPHDRPEYLPYIVSLMNFFHSPIPKFTKQTEFTRSQLLAINPTVIKRWLSIEAYGKEEYDPDVDEPKSKRANSLKFAKKAVSYFMPNKPKWMKHVGNPTKHEFVTKVINDVLKAEARQRGKETQTKRPLKVKEFEKTFEIFQKSNNWADQILYPTMCLWQYTLIGRNDDVCHFKVNNPKGYPSFDFALMTKVRWSKNVSEERNCPDQILLGAMNDTYCILIMLSIYLESYLTLSPTAYYLYTNDTSKKAVERLKSRYRNRLTKFVWNSEEFNSVISQEDRNQGVGTHSQRKFPATFASRQGCTSDEIEIRGRWKHTNGKVVHRYIDCKQSYVDAKVASKLCVGGPVKYSIKDNVNGITNEWLFEHVIPAIRFRFENDDQLCSILGKSLLYAALSEKENQIVVPESIRIQIKTAYNQLRQEEPQPVQKIPLIVTRRDDSVEINEYVDIGREIQIGQIHGGVASLEYFQSMLIRLNQLEHIINVHAAQSESNMSEMRQFINKKVKVLNNNIRNFGGSIEGSFRIQGANAGRTFQRISMGDSESALEPLIVENMATLSHNPRSLVELWREYQFGIDGRKPARDFTPQERNNRVGGIKQKYYRRRFVWNAIKYLISTGMTSQSAIAKLRDLYGHSTSISNIIEKIRRDKNEYGENGGYHPNLV